MKKWNTNTKNPAEKTVAQEIKDNFQNHPFKAL